MEYRLGYHTPEPCPITPRAYSMAVGPWVFKGRPSPSWWYSFIFLFLPSPGHTIPLCNLRDTESTMASSQIAIIIPDDEEALGLEQGRSRPQRAPRRDYSYRGWEDTMDDAAVSDDATDDVTISPARKRKRNMTDGESIASILV